MGGNKERRAERHKEGSWTRETSGSTSQFLSGGRRHDLDKSGQVLPGSRSLSDLVELLGLLRILGPPTPFPGFALEALNSTEGSAEGGCHGSYSPPPALPLFSPVLTVEEPSFTTVELCQDGEDVSLTAHEGGMEEMGDQDPGCGGVTRKKQRVPFQIFPDPAEVILGPEACLSSLDHGRTKERLPSIVVEPTEVSEVESGELRWPPEDIETEDDEEDLFLEQCIPPPNIADWEKDEEEEEKTAIILNQHPGLTLIDLQSDAFRDDTPTLPPSSAPSFI